MLSKSSINHKIIFIWDHDNSIESRKNINHEFHFSTNQILKKSEIKKQLEKLKDHKLKKKI